MRGLKVYEGVGANLEYGGDLTSYDYQYLKGTWDGPQGAAFNVVYEYCKNHGYGLYGAPTDRGKIAMVKYERATN